ncbi:MAG: sugar phosphate isomerase/epimerase family protein [Armatimonadota bacterium]|nr:sugar phosphate isomerase/epimerase family protein [Armatimonadota bacterium]
MPMTPGIMWMGSIYPPVWHDEKLTPAELFGNLKGMGVEAIDIFARAADQDGVDTLAKALGDSGLGCACYYISADLVSDEPQRQQAADEAFPKGLDAARRLGAPICFTHGSQHAHRGEGNFQRYMDRLGEKLELFEGTGVTLVIENAGWLLHTAEDMVRACEALGSDGLRLCPDTGNFTLWGQDEVDAVRRCLPWSAHFHIKDVAERWEEDGNPRGTEAILGQGMTPVEQIIGILKDERWEGVLAWEPGPQDEEGVTASVRELLRLIG